MKDRQIYVTQYDRDRLAVLLEEMDSFSVRDRKDIQSLKTELEAARVVESKEIPPTVITMNSKLSFMDLEDQSETTVTLVFPAEANIDEGRLSVLSPIGTALLGYAEGDLIEWAVPAGTRRIQIKRVLYQPEAAGKFRL